MKKILLFMVVLIVMAVNPAIHAQITTTTTPSQCTLELTPSSVSLYTWEPVQFGTTASGECNTPCYTWEISVMGSTGSTINTNGLYTGGGNVGTDQVRVTDPCNNNISDTATVNVISSTTTVPTTTSTTTIGPCTLDIYPSSRTVTPGSSIQFSADESGACSLPCYTWEISQMGSTGSTITANGLYTAGGSIGTDQVSVTDPCNNNITDSALVNVGTTTTTLPTSTSTSTIIIPEGPTYLMNGSNPRYLGLDPTECVTVTISLDPNSHINTPLITAGFWLVYNVSQISINNVAVYDGELAPALWDPGFTGKIPDAGGPGTYMLTVGNFATVSLDDLRIADVEFCATGRVGYSQIIISTIPGFDTVVGDTTVWDPVVEGVIDLEVVPSAPCDCTSLEPSAVELHSNEVVIFVPQVTGACQHNEFLFTDDCTEGDVNSSTGFFTAGTITADEVCTVTATDRANTGLQCTSELSMHSSGGIGEIALGRECPGEDIDDPAYNRPGRRGLVATCGDIIDFTLCTNSLNDPCPEWTVEPAESWMTFNQIDDCCWRLAIGENCQELTKTKEYEVRVEDTCQDWSDSIILEVGKVVIDLGNTAVNPESGTAEVAVDLINPDHHVRALAFDVVGMGDDNLDCTACTADPDRALPFTCSAAEQDDGSCRVVMFSTDPSALIQAGDGQVATILYNAIDPSAGDCVMLMPINEQASDAFNEDLCTCGAPGEVCFKTCGDIYPQDCIGGECADEVCGDGVVDLFDILEAIDIILALQEATICQIGNANVPNGMPPYCGDPPGDPNCEMMVTWTSLMYWS